MYGGTIAKDLLKVAFNSASTSGGEEENADLMDVDPDDGLEVDESKWKAEAYCTSANYHAKKFMFLLFINRR
jgi:DNA mismatch repair protein MLH1